MKSISNNRDENVRSITMQSAVLCLKSVSIIMAALLTSHPHNICVLAMATLQEILLRKLLSFIKLPVYATALIYAWMAQATYFYQVSSLTFLIIITPRTLYGHGVTEHLTRSIHMSQ